MLKVRYSMPMSHAVFPQHISNDKPGWSDKALRFYCKDLMQWFNEGLLPFPS